VPQAGLIVTLLPATMQSTLPQPPPPVPNKQEYVEKVTPFCTIGTSAIGLTVVVIGKDDIGILGILNYIILYLIILCH
jgi:hypothetical protein